MTDHDKNLSMLLDKDAIRELVLLYCRGVDRNDIELLRTLYTRDATDDHGRFFSGSAQDYLRYLENSLPHLRMSAHFICNHLVSVDDDRGEGEVYALAYHVLPDGKGGWIEDFKALRYLDRYAKHQGRWLFASRVVEFDHERAQPISTLDARPTTNAEDASYGSLCSRLFARGGRAPS